MKISAANAIAKLARERVPDEVAAAMGGDRPKSVSYTHLTLPTNREV